MSNETKDRARGSASKLRWAALAAGVLLVAGGVGYLKMRGPSGATAALGGSIAATPAPELPADAARWVNGEPISLAGARGQLLFVEGWHPA